METQTLKLLAIDDRPANLAALETVLLDALPGSRILTAHNGPKGIELALDEDPDVILLDIGVSGVDGFSICRTLKANERTRAIPVVFLTALRTDRQQLVRAMEAGAEAFLPTPWEKTELVAQVRALSGIRSGNRRLPDEADGSSARAGHHMSAPPAGTTERRRAEETLERLHQQNELILQSTAEGILGLDLNGNHTFVNLAAARMLGYAPNDLVGRHSHSMWHHTKADGSPYPKEECAIYAAYRDGRVHRSSEEVFWRKDGTSFPVEFASTPIYADELLVGAVVTFTDITERRQTEEVQTFLARTSSGSVAEPFFHALARYLAKSLAMDFVCIDRLEGDGLTAQTLAVWSDGGFQDNVRYGLKDTPCGVVVGKTVCCFPAGVAQAFPLDGVLQELRAESYAGVTLFGHTGKPIGLIAVIARTPLQDTERVEAVLKMVAVRAAGELERLDSEQALTLSEQRLREAQRVARVGSWELDLATSAVVWSESLFRMVGRDRTLPPPAFADLPRYYTTESWERLGAAVQLAVSTGAGYELDLEVIREDGTHWWQTARGEAVRSQSGEVVRLQGTVLDITDRKQAEEALRRNEMELREAQRVAGVGSWEWIVGSDAISWSDELRRLLGLGPSQPVPAFSRVASSYVPDSWARLQVAIEKALNAGEPYELDLQMVRADGTSVWTTTRGEVVRDHSGKIVALRGTVLDISARKLAEQEKDRLQAQLSQAQKMESVGLLAGGVAHDFNNMLGVILGLAELAQEQVDPADPLADDLREIHKAAERSADLTRQLLTFAARQTVAPKALDLNETLDGMLKMLRRLIGEDIDLVWLPGTKLWPVMVDPSQIDQILANLCLNARDAIDGVGKITIETENVAFADSSSADQDVPAPGEYVMLTVRDDGCGMNDETLRRLFEPFFTTKGMGRGTGLGLATVYGIVKQNNGSINVFSRVGEGTTFRICLPRHVGETTLSGRNGPAEPAGHGKETILLVEDEISVLDLAKRVLERLGYRVLAASTPAEAVRLAGEHADHIDLLLTDVIMPEMSGRDLAARLRSRQENLRCLFMSGYTADIIAHHGMLNEAVNFIQKPFSTKALAAKVRQVLDAAPANLN